MLADSVENGTAVENTSPAPRRGFSHAAWQGLGWVVLIGLLAAISYLFYFHGYRYFIANSSSSSTVELVRRKILVSADAQTLVIGNSVVAEGFQASAYNKLSGQSVPAVNLGIPSGHMFLYEKILDTALDGGLHPKAVVLMITPEILNFSSDPYFDYLKNDLTVLKVELEWRDIPRLANHSRTFFHQLDYAAPIVFRPSLYSADLRDFATHPVQRLKDSNYVYGWMNSLTTPESFPEPDHAFSVCQAEPLENMGERLEAERRRPDNPILPDLERVWNGYEDRTKAGKYLKVDDFERDRLHRLLQRMAQKVRYVFLVPAPYYDPHYTQQPVEYRAAFAENLRKLSEEDEVIHLLPAYPIDCSLMLDTVHLNRKGGEQFAGFLHDYIEQVLSHDSESDQARERLAN